MKTLALITLLLAGGCTAVHVPHDAPCATSDGGILQVPDWLRDYQRTSRDAPVVPRDGGCRR